MQEPTGEWVIETQAGRCVEFKVDPSNIFDIGGGHYINTLLSIPQKCISKITLDIH